jgi:hypothetical protein
VRFMDRERVIAEAEALIRRGFEHVEKTRILRSTVGDPEQDRPGGWTILARVQVFNALGITTRLVAINEELGERRILDGWMPGQPYEQRHVLPEWVKRTPLPPMPQLNRSDER